ncbi:MAG: hypothetical protein JNM93_02645 [Bacteriovoracaceae bacterium]|nr:hypothetical protein [Bacteriovoracaceae bacterium]
MTKTKLTKSEQQFLIKTGENIRKIILEDMGYQSLDSFALEHHDKIAKPTLYAICDGKRDFQISTFLRLAKVLGLSFNDLIK